MKKELIFINRLKKILPYKEKKRTIPNVRYGGRKDRLEVKGG